MLSRTSPHLDAICPRRNSPRKRRSSEQLTPQRNKSSQLVSKTRKRSHPSGSQPPRAFWDNLSKIDLTRRALEELERRNTQAALNSRPLYPRSHRPTTRRVLAELKKSSQPLTPAAEYLSHCGSSGLKNIKQTARHGGPDLSDLRGLPEASNPLNPAMNPTPSSFRVPKLRLASPSSTRLSANTTNTGPYNRNFNQNLIDGGVYSDGYEYPDGQVPLLPANWEEINRKLAQPRPSLSSSTFSENEFRKFIRADAHASKEKQVTTSVIPIIEGDIGDARCVSGGIPFTNLDPLTDGTLVPGNPDIYYGARPEQLDRRVRGELSGHIIPSTQDDLPIAPNFFLAVKGPDGSPAVAKRQACYDGALGARAIHSLRSYGQESSSHDNNAYTISTTYHDGYLMMFTSHPAQATTPGSRSEYHMHQLNTWGMTGNIGTFRQGATYYRNGRDWAKEQRDEAIRRANERVDEHHAGTLAIDASLAQASSFASEATSDGTSTIEAITQKSRISLTEDSNTTTHLQISEVSSGDPSVDYRTSVKRSSERSKEFPQSQRKRRNAGHSDYDLSQQSELQPSEPSGLSQQVVNQVLEQEPNRQSRRYNLRSDTLRRTKKPVSKKKKA